MIARFAGVFIFNKLSGSLGISSNWVNIFDRLWLIFLVVVVSGSFMSYPIKLNFSRLLRLSVIGLAAGAALFAFSQGLERLLGFFFASDSSTHPLVSLTAQAKSFREFLVPFFIGAVLVPVSEELYYRGLAYPVFKKHWGLIVGLIIHGLFFAVFHFNAVWVTEIVLVAVALALIYEFTGSLIPGVIAHAVVNGMRLLMVYFSY